ncbi:MAG: LysR family transcriptional regulator [Polyangiaceae bacterium]|nr:LysR family transcriptional regulator [Polyangiaceae bacterium]
MKTPVDLQLLENFAAVAEFSSFSKAAAKLGVAKGTVSRSISQLEALLGVELLHRTTHHVALSTAGTALYERTQAHLAALRSAVVDLPEREEAPSGLLRMTAPPDFGAMVLPPVVAAFSRRFPNVRFDIRLSAQRVDLVKEGYDLAIRVTGGSLDDSNLTVRRVARDTVAFFAAPSYIARRGRPKQIGDERHSWVLHHLAVRLLQMKADSVEFLVDDFFLARELMRDGLGIGALPSFVARPYVREGLLEEVSVEHPPVSAGHLVILYPSRRQTPKKVSAFRDFLIDALRSGVG